MSAQFSVSRRARRALLKSIAAAMALMPVATAFARVAPPASELACIPVASDSRGYRRTQHIERYYRSTVGLYE
jgi:hypothetical protein